MRAFRIVVTLATFAGATAIARPAAAEERDTASLELGYFEHHASELYSVYEGVYSASPRLSMWLTERVSLAASLAFVHLRDQTAAGNLVIRVPYAGDHGALGYRFGVEVGLPTSDVTEDGFDANQALLGAGVGRGNWDLWRWAYGWSAVALPAEVIWRLGGGELRLEVTAAYGRSSANARLLSTPLVQSAVGYTHPITGCLSARARGGLVGMVRGDDQVLDRFVEAAAVCALDSVRFEVAATQPWIAGAPYSLPGVVLRAEVVR